MEQPPQTDPERDVRLIIGSVTHTDGTTTFGSHVRNEAGGFTCLELQDEPIDPERWVWAAAQTQRVLRGLPIEPYVPPRALL